MALPALTVDRARSLFAVATGVALAIMLLAAIVEVTFDGMEHGQHPTFYTEEGGDYFAYQEIFGFPGWRLTGTWVAPHANPPDAVRLVAGSDVDRMLAGQVPQHVYATFEAWPGGSTGDVNVRIPEFTCTGPNGACEDGDLPAVVFTRGSAWEGTPRSALVSDFRTSFHADLGLTVTEAWVQPVLVTLIVLAFACVLVSFGAGLAWARLRRRTPLPPAAPMQGEAPLEMTLRLVDLSRMYLGSIGRSLYIGGGIVLLGGLSIEFLALPSLDELHNDFHPLGDERIELLFTVMHWWIIPYGLVVAGIFWARQLRQLRAEQRRWSLVADRLDSLQQQVLA